MDEWKLILTLGSRKIDLNFLKYDLRLRKIIFGIAWLIFGLWMVLGWDSCQSQFEFVLVELPRVLFGKTSLDELVAIYHDQYGKGMHYSAWVIYGLMCWGLMKYYDTELGLHKTRNFSLALAFTLLSIACFETFWHYSYAIFQGQTWIIRWEVPQLKILVQNLSFFILGLGMIFLMSLKDGRLYYLGKWNVFDLGVSSIPLFSRIKGLKIPYPSRDGALTYWKPNTNFPQYRLNVSRWTLTFFLFFLASVFVWYNYGAFFPVDTLYVSVKGHEGMSWGIWESSPYFPQTVYTIETDLTDGINAGVQFFLENDLIHGINTLCKVLLTLTTYQLGRVKTIEEIERPSSI